MSLFTPEQIAEWRTQKGNGMTSAIGEYTPEEFWLALDEIERLQQALKLANSQATANTIVVSAEPLRRVLQALVGAPHLIRELQVTRHPAELFKENPINVLAREYNAGGIREQAEVKP